MTNQKKKAKGKTEKEIKSRRRHNEVGSTGCLKPQKMKFLSIILVLKDYAKMTSFYLFTECYCQCLYLENDIW